MTAEHDHLWFEDEGFWHDFYPHLFSEARVAEAARIVAGSPLFRFPPGARILDLCCGPGLFTVPLARAGHTVTGVDRSAPLLKAADAALRDAGAEARLVEADMLDFAEPEAFDAVVNMYTSFGYFDRPEDNLQVLRNAYTSLAPGGTFLVDVVGKEILARLDERVSLTEVDDRILIQRDTVLDDWSRLRSDWFSLVGDRVARASMTLYVYSAAELRHLLETAGFDRVDVFGGYDGAPYDHRADRLVVVARKGVTARAD
ncbi:class I SAM-dependent methyltransferase [Streptomyces sp. NPDC001135]